MALPMYQYTQLLHSDETRFMIIEPGESSDPVRCRLFHERFSNDPIYEALSYTWGGEEKPCWLGINAGDRGSACELSVTQNCFNALRTLRRTDRCRTMWIDAVCINQSEIPERGQQVRIMPEIYRNAKSVIVYLGEGTGSSDIAMSSIFSDLWKAAAKYEEDETTTSSIAVTTEESVHQKPLLAREWFSRIWVLQEVYMARTATVVCGKKFLPWEPYFRLLGGWRSENVLSDRTPQVLTIRQRRNVENARSRELLDLLADTRSCNCKDPRDRVFALLSMSNAKYRAGLIADYSMSVEQVYINAAAEFLRLYGLDVVFSAVESKEGDYSCTTPSWVPDWTIPQTSTPLTKLIVGGTHTQGTAPSPESRRTWNIQDTSLRVRGRFTVTIDDSLGSVYTPDRWGLDRRCLRAWFAIFIRKFPDPPMVAIVDFYRILHMEVDSAQGYDLFHPYRKAHRELGRSITRSLVKMLKARRDRVPVGSHRESSFGNSNPERLGRWVDCRSMYSAKKISVEQRIFGNSDYVVFAYARFLMAIVQALRAEAGLLGSKWSRSAKSPTWGRFLGPEALSEDDVRPLVSDDNLLDEETLLEEMLDAEMLDEDPDLTCWPCPSREITFFLHPTKMPLYTEHVANDIKTFPAGSVDSYQLEWYTCQEKRKEYMTEADFEMSHILRTRIFGHASNPSAKDRLYELFLRSVHESPQSSPEKLQKLVSTRP